MKKMTIEEKIVKKTGYVGDIKELARTYSGTGKSLRWIASRVTDVTKIPCSKNTVMRWLKSKE